MPYLLLTLAAMFWGGNYVVGHILVSGADPILMTAARWFLTALLLTSLYYKHIFTHHKLIIQSLATIVFLSVFGQVLFPLTLYIGLQTTSSLNAAIYMSATPCLVLLINRIIFHDQISVNNYLGVLLSTAGVCYLIFQGDFGNLRTLNNLSRGDLWAMGSALSWALYCSFLRKKNKQIPGNVFVAVSAVIGAIILIPVITLYLISVPSVDVSSYSQAGFLTGLLYLVIFPSWLSYVFWNRGITEIGATRGEIYTHIIPLSGGLFSVIFLGTRLASFHLISAALIAAGIWLCSGRKSGEKTIQPVSSE
ncbi:DMT family transporter [Vibrio quintilis]|uniref:EamA-like transporter family protein n=1 Tax=Vibrio quintilis TaxID=1117707 RepID=A0A1M7YUK3_9VIBR|nr:DMT family transporter [Vibrio quintilis]SHO56282.1 EamA-like transporter family protein [Vibrio quintilis]